LAQPHFFVSRLFYPDNTQIIDLLAEKKQVPLWVPYKAIKEDSQGSFIWRVKKQQVFKPGSVIDEVLTVERVAVKPSKVFKNVPIFRFNALQDHGTLNEFDVILVDAPDGLKDNEQVLLVELQWLFNPNETVRVKIPNLMQTGIYVPDYAVFSDATDDFYVFILRDDKIIKIPVELVGGFYRYRCIQGAGIEEGAVIFVGGVNTDTISGSAANNFDIIDPVFDFIQNK